MYKRQALERDAAAMMPIGRVVVMGGALTVPGNVSAGAEANMASDPEAADAVLRSGRKLTIDVYKRQADGRAFAAHADRGRPRRHAGPARLSRSGLRVARRGPGTVSYTHLVSLVLSLPVIIGSLTAIFRSMLLAYNGNIEIYVPWWSMACLLYTSLRAFSTRSRLPNP